MSPAPRPRALVFDVMGTVVDDAGGVRDATRAVLARRGDHDEDELSGVVHRFDPWPDSAAGLAELREDRVVVAPSNADPAEIAGLSRHGGLARHLARSTRPSQTFKPDPRAYAGAIEALELAPAEIMKVATHPWDLRGAERLGMQTCSVRRSGEDPAPEAAELDLVVGDLLELADELGRSGS